MEAVIGSKSTLSKLSEPVKMLPQITKNIRVEDKRAVREDSDVRDCMDRVTEDLKGGGRILLRESGTEPVVRIMVEADTEDLCERYASQVASVIYKKGLAKES